MAGRRVEFDRDKAVDLYKSGMTPTEIGRQLGVGYHPIITHLKSLGLYTPVSRSKSSNSKTKSNKTKKSNSKSQGTKVKSVSSLVKEIKTVNSSSNKKSKTKDKEVKSDIISMEEKIAYCDEKYGKGNWHFMSKTEFINMMLFENSFRNNQY